MCVIVSIYGYLCVSKYISINVITTVYSLSMFNYIHLRVRMNLSYVQRKIYMLQKNLLSYENIISLHQSHSLTFKLISSNISL